MGYFGSGWWAGIPEDSYSAGGAREWECAVPSAAVPRGRVARLSLSDGPSLRCTTYGGFLKGSLDLQMSALLVCLRS